MFVDRSWLFGYERGTNARSCCHRKDSYFARWAILKHFRAAVCDILTWHDNLVCTHAFLHFKWILFIHLEPFNFLYDCEWVQFALVGPFGIISTSYKVELISCSIDFSESKVYLFVNYRNCFWQELLICKVVEFQFSFIMTFHYYKVAAMTDYSKLISILRINILLKKLLILCIMISSNSTISFSNLLKS